jgi:hypothetical protein
MMSSRKEMNSLCETNRRQETWGPAQEEHEW